MSISLMELIDYVKKHVSMIVVAMMIGGILGQFYYDKAQRFYASTNIKYIFENADKGMNPKGESLDVYEMISPTVMERVIKSMGLDMGMEQMRSSIMITPFVNKTTKQKQEAMIKQGEEFEFFPTEYTVSYTYDKRFGMQHGVKALNKLLESYDSYIQETYTNTRKIPDVFTNIDYSKYDYMEICELYNQQIDTILEMLNSYESQTIRFRSAKTGLNFGDLKMYFYNLKNTEYTKLYSIVRSSCLSRNKELFLKNLTHKIEQLQLIQNKKSEEAKVSYQVLLDFYRQYKSGQSYTALDRKAADQSGRIIYEEDIGDIITTYDEIITGYVDSGVLAANAEKDIENYKKLMTDFSKTNLSPEKNAEYIEQAELFIKRIDSQLKTYISLANETLNDYNVYKGTEYISYLSSVSVESKLSRKMIVGFGGMLGMSMGLVAAVGIEILKKMKEEAQLNDKRKKLKLLEDGVLPKDIESMPPIDRALFEAIADEFKEFYLLYQPIADVNGKWVGAEAFVRWRSKDFGTVLPMDFISIAEKYDIMEMLGKWILHEACKTCKEWNQTLSEDLFVSVNFTLNQVGSRIFMDDILRTLNEIKLNPKNLILEISNGHQIEGEFILSQKLSAIKTFGVGIALDNFENKASALQNLYKIPIDLLKFRVTTTEGKKTVPEEEAYIRSLVGIGNTSGFKICAEAVEEKDRVKRLGEIGVSYVQGYYLSAPVTDEQFKKNYYKK